jgi:hypothetical protein
MYKVGLFLALGLLASPAEAQIVVTGARSVADCPPSRVVPDRGASVSSPRRLRNRYFAARPVYPPAPQGARANVTFEPYTSKYFPTENSYYPPLPVVPSARIR